jgi:flavin reductase (DIM6/NTAB) family NADH-FMN oxidoreductase RutF
MSASCAAEAVSPGAQALAQKGSVPDDPGIDPVEFRRVLGCFATGITVITAPAAGHVHGMTANAFMSGSLDPPLVVVSIARRARLREHIEQSGVFGVSIFSEAQEMHSAHFAGQADNSLAPRFESHAGVPVLADALAAIATRVDAAHACGDHVLYVGRVLRLWQRDGRPLLYYRGAYRHLSETEKLRPTFEFVW